MPQTEPVWRGLCVCVCVWRWGREDAGRERFIITGIIIIIFFFFFIFFKGDGDGMEFPDLAPCLHHKNPKIE
jgi:hypothetical protein